MKFKKVNYFIAGRFTEGRKHGIMTKAAETGYTVEGIDDIAIKKRGGWWYVDHIPTGFGLVTTGCKTREEAVKAYEEGPKAYLENADRAKRENLKKAAADLETMPTEEEVATWETVNYCTTKNHRFDKVTDAARRAGLLVKKADDATYLDGGNVNIIGPAEKLQAVREMIAEYEKMDKEAAAAECTKAEPAADPEPETVPAGREENKMQNVKFTPWEVVAGDTIFPAEYNIANDTHEMLVFITTGTKEDGRPIKQKVIIPKTDPAYDAAKLAYCEARKMNKERAAEAEAAEAAKAEREAKKAARAAKKAEKEAAKAAAAADPEKPARTVPEKSFIGERILGRGWQIYFNPELEKTQVIFEKFPTKEARETVKAAGFWWNAYTKSWNKGLTMKAYRAALQLSKDLTALRKVTA